MKKYMQVSADTLVNLANCFSSSDEVMQFLSQMDGVVDEMIFLKKVLDRVSEDDEAAVIMLKQIAVFTIFCRMHMDLIQQLVKQCNAKEISEEDLKQPLDE